jgi:epoxyqueuosine reductase
VSLAEIEARLARHALAVLGGFQAADGDDLPAGTRTLLLIGPRQPGFWPLLTASAEWQDGAPDPVDRWSRRVIGRIACDLGAKAVFPFGGPPWRPFYTWALRTGRVHASPVRLLVHDEAGLMVSFRGALALKEALDLPPAPPSPCVSCEGKPCLSACPPQALTGEGYDLPACHGFLDSPEGQGCMTMGCAVRRACPVSARHARLPGQSAYHMQQFHRGQPGP